jgi:hypothetical protein
MDSQSCDICTEKFNRSTRIRVKCEYCEFTACRTCFETYLLSQSTPHCMCSKEQCGKIWTRKFLANTFTNVFITKRYKTHQEQVLFEKELALMPATQLLIERKIYREKKMEEYNEELRNISNMINELYVRKNEIERLKRRLTYDLHNNEEEDGEDNNEENNDGEGNDGEGNDGEEDNDGEETKGEKEPKIKFSYRCSNENCRGFLSSRWKCKLCETWTCSECRVNVGTNEDKLKHVCNNDDLETAKMLKKDSKPCPKCGIIIFKIDGCDQMYCTQCHTPFSWRTGDIEIGRNIHNPHYFEYMRNHGGGLPRNPLDIQCARILDGNFLSRFNSLLVYVSTNYFKADDVTTKIILICRHISHLDAEIIYHRQNIDLNENKKQQYRIRYLKNEITEEDFKKIIQINEKKYQKQQELMNLFVMVRDTGTEILYLYADKLNKIEQVLNLVRDKHIYTPITSNYHINSNIRKLTEEQLKINDVSGEKILLEFNNLRNYANDCFDEISKTYHSINRNFNETFAMVKKIKEKKQSADDEDETSYEVIIES